VQEQDYGRCQAAPTHHADDYYEWVVELANQHHARAVDAEQAMALARRINPLTGQPLGPWWDLFYGDPA
jgi:hypothetical protein